MVMVIVMVMVMDGIVDGCHVGASWCLLVVFGSV